MSSKKVDYEAVLERCHRNNPFVDLLRISGNSATNPLKVDIFVRCQQLRVQHLQVEDVFAFARDDDRQDPLLAELQD